MAAGRLRLDWRLRQQLATLALLGVLAGAIFSVTRLNERFDARRQREPAERVLYLPKGDSLKFMCLGYNGIAADMVWIRSVMYVGRKLRDRDTKYDWLEKLYQVTTDLDPHWTRPYRVGAILLSALPEDDERAMNLLRRGMSRNPWDWEIPYQAAQLNLLRGRNHEALKWFTLISKTMHGYSPAVDVTMEQLHIEGQDYAQALGLASAALRSGNDRLLAPVHRLNYRESLARMTAMELTGWSRSYAAAKGGVPADVRELLAVRLAAAGGGAARTASVRDLLRLRLEPLIGRAEARDFTDKLPTDTYGLQFRMRPGGEVGSQGIERIELFRLLHIFNFHLEEMKKKNGRSAGSLDELVDYWQSLYKRGDLTSGLADIVGRPPRLPAHPSGDSGAWKAMPLVDGLLVLPSGPSIEQMYSAPLAMPAGPDGPTQKAANRVR